MNAKKISVQKPTQKIIQKPVTKRAVVLPRNKKNVKAIEEHHLPQELVLIILKLAGFSYKVIIPFLLTCKWYCVMLTNLYFKEKYIGDCELTKSQVLQCMRMWEYAQSKKEVFYLRYALIAPMGWGKTLTLLYYLETYYPNKNILVIVPPPVVKVWVDECEKAGLFHSKPEHSSVLILNSSRSAHWKYARECNGAYYEEHYIVISSYTTASNMSPWNEADIVVIDEYHKFRRGYVKKDVIDSKYPWEKDKPVITLGLTAETQINDKQCYLVKSPDDTFKTRIPKIRYEYYTCTTDYTKTEHHGADIYAKKEFYKSKALECMEHKPLVVLCTDKGVVGTETRSIITDLFPSRKVFELKGSTTTIDKFLDYDGEAIMYVNSLSNEGLTICAENLVFMKPDSLGITRARQMIGRLLREANPHEEICVSFITSDNIGHLKSIYCACYSSAPWDFGFHDAPAIECLTKASTLIKLLGCSNVEEVPYPDGCVIFDTMRGPQRFEVVLEWWLEYHTDDTILNQETIAMIYL